MSWRPLVLSLLVLLPAHALADEGSTGAEWPSYGGTARAWRHSSLTQIDRGNVRKLAPVWVSQTGDYEGGLQATPIVTGGVLYLSTAHDRVFALDAATGAERWHYQYELPRDF